MDLSNKIGPASIVFHFAIEPIEAPVFLSCANRVEGHKKGTSEARKAKGSIFRKGRGLAVGIRECHP